MANSYTLHEEEGLQIELTARSGRFELGINALLQRREGPMGSTSVDLDLGNRFTADEVLAMAVQMIQAVLYHEPQLHKRTVQQVRDLPV